VTGQSRILPRRTKGDNNANNRLDIGDATVIQRLVTHLDEVRSWDVTGNDLNVTGDLDSGDVTKVLRVVVGLDGQPIAASAISPCIDSQKARADATLPPEMVLLAPTNLAGHSGDLVTVQILLQDIRSALMGTSFKLLYPTNALRLMDGNAHRTGALVPANSIALWNVSPSQNDYQLQSGMVALAVSSATAWSASNGVLAELTFQIQPGYSSQAEWQLQLTQAEITDNGYDIRSLPDSAAIFKGEAPTSFRLDWNQSSLQNDGFHFSISGATSGRFGIQTSTNLVDWTWLFEPMDWQAPMEFKDTNAVQHQQRFYKVISGN
jgi:hypothetical protein